MNALSTFVIAYASMQHRENTQHFSHMNPVYGYLLSAKQDLEKHKETMLLADILNELRNTCVSNSNQLVRTFTQFTVEDEKWPLVKTATMEELSQGLLTKKYIHSEVKGVVIWSNNMEEIPESPIKKWIMTLAKYYLQTLDNETKLNCKDILTLDQLFTYPNLERFSLLKINKKNNSKSEAAERKKIEAELKLLNNVFNECTNFLTTKLDPKTKNSTPKFIPITENHELIERTKVMAKIARLIHQIIFLQYLSSHLIKSIKQLGEIYVKNPQHFVMIFSVLDELCNQVKESIVSIKAAFKDI